MNTRLVEDLLGIKTERKQTLIEGGLLVGAVFTP